MIPFLKQLIIQTILKPEDAARVVLALRLTAGQGAMVLALAAILNGIILYATTLLNPQSASVDLLAGISPTFLVVMFFTMFAISAGFLTFAGRAMDGAADLSMILSLLGWLQLMRVVLQVAGVAVALLSPALSSILTFFAGLYGLWILIQFIKVANGFDNLGKPFSILGLSFLGLTVAFIILLTLSGVTITG